MRPAALAALLMLSGCATSYAFQFERTDVPTDSDVTFEATLDPLLSRAISLTVHNLTQEPIEVGWTRVAVRAPDGTETRLRPDEDLGWVAPGQTLTAQLSPFTLPGAGEPAHALDGQRFELTIPLTVHNEPRMIHSQFTAHVRPL